MITDAELSTAFKAHTEGQTIFTRRMAISIADFFNVPPRFIVQRLEQLALLKDGSWDWFIANGGITSKHVREARSGRTALGEQSE